MKKKSLLFILCMLFFVLIFSSCSNISTNHEHDFGEWETQIPSTCITEGTTVRYCKCGEMQSKKSPIIDHSWQPATCEVAKKCNNCNATEGIPRGHNIVEEITKKATSSSSGAKFLSCTRCNYSAIEPYTLSEYTSEEIYELAEKSVAEVTTYDKLGQPIAIGTAFVIENNGTLITNFHVIENAYSVSVTLNENDYSVVEVLAYSKNIDLAVLKINASTPNVLSIQTQGIKGGATVYAVGSSEGYTLSFSTGVIASPNRILSGVTYIQHEAAISHGNSGGPLLNSYGEVIGINTMTNISGQNLNFAISCSELDNLEYENKLTMSEFYEKECNVFLQIKNHIVENGTYDPETNEYLFWAGSDYFVDSTEKYYRTATYCIDSNEIVLSLFDSFHFVSFTIDETISGVYEWIFLDQYDYYLGGSVVSAYYNTDSLLTVRYYDLGSSTLSDMRDLASTMLSLLCFCICDDFANINISAYDLGFYHYN